MLRGDYFRSAYVALKRLCFAGTTSAGLMLHGDFFRSAYVARGLIPYIALKRLCLRGDYFRRAYVARGLLPLRLNAYIARGLLAQGSCCTGIS